MILVVTSHSQTVPLAYIHWSKTKGMWINILPDAQVHCTFTDAVYRLLWTLILSPVALFLPFFLSFSLHCLSSHIMFHCKMVFGGKRGFYFVEELVLHILLILVILSIRF